VSDRILNADGSFMSPDQIVENLLSIDWTDPAWGEMTESFLSCTDSIIYHFGLGTWIRNSYGLWDKTNPHVKGHPDDFSGIIIKRFIEAFQEKHRNKGCFTLP